MDKSRRMKVLILGDIHGRTCWKNIVEKEIPDYTIFLGDYVSTYDKITPREQINNLLNILDYKESNPEGVILLRGNHDMQHLGYHWAECSGLDIFVQMQMMNFKDRFLNDTQWLYILPGAEQDILFSHAGISKKWMELYGIKSIYDINGMEPSETFGFTPCKMSDYYGVSSTQPLTWIRPGTLIEYKIDNYIQVVGHTRMLNNNIFTKDSCWFCDTLPHQYLIIEDNEFKIKTYKE